MSDNHERPSATPSAAQSAATAVAALAHAVTAELDGTDLGRLARMHTWCQELDRADAPGPDASASDTIRALARALVGLLEALILDEAADAKKGLILVPQAVSVIGRAHRGEAVDARALVTEVWAVSGRESRPENVTVTPEVQPLATAAQAAATPLATECTDSCENDVPSASDAASSGPATATDRPAIEPYVSEPLVVDLNEVEHLQGFLDESREHLDAIEAALLEVENDPTDPSKLNELFRPFHTIKGIAGFLNLRDINRLTHEVETILDLARKSALAIEARTIDLVFAAIDILSAQIAAIREYLAHPTGGAIPQPDITDIMGRLRTVAAGQPAPPADRTAQAAVAQKTGEFLVAQRATEPEVVDLALDIQESDAQARRVGEILVDLGSVTRKQVGRALQEQAARQQSASKTGAEQSIRVDTTKLDALVDAVGELVIAQTMVNLNEAIRANEKLSRDVSQVGKIVRDVQETAMAMRMVPIGPTFQKMRRLVRDVARKAGKQVELTIAGEDTELDKTVIQQISDPLVHMVRNAIDHGVESPATRRQAGKPETGNVYLYAFHQGDSIVIEVRDDGAGLDRDRLVAKAVERGMLSAADQLSDQQAYALILAPGFSTAEKVTDISGRGVGMDVVKRNIDALRGKIEISSAKGRGSTFSIRLPLTLAIIDGMLVRVGDKRLVLPTILIERSLCPEAKQITTVQGRGQVLHVRGELCPLIQLGELFGYSGPIDPRRALVVIAHSAGGKIGLVVNELIGQQQVVIKSLGERFKQVKGVSGVAILGDGRVGLILEPTGLLALHSLRRQSVVRPGGPSLMTGAALPSATGRVADDVPADVCADFLAADQEELVPALTQA